MSPLLDKYTYNVHRCNHSCLDRIRLSCPRMHLILRIIRTDSHTMEGLCTKHLSFSLLAKNFKKRSFEARSDKHSCYILGYFYPVLHPPAWQFWHHTVRNWPYNRVNSWLKPHANTAVWDWENGNAVSELIL